MKDERSGAERCWIWRDSYHYPRVSFAKPDRIHPSVEYVLAPQPAADTIAKPQGSLASNQRIPEAKRAVESFVNSQHCKSRTEVEEVLEVLLYVTGAALNTVRTGKMEKLS